MRKLFIAGNWKMNKTAKEAVTLVNTIKAGVHQTTGCDILVAPAFTSLASVSEILEGSNIELGAQNMYFEAEGAYTGEISPLMLKDVGCRYVILGHSERRSYFKESDSLVNKKARAALKYNLVPIVCVGETLEQREAGEARNLVKSQIEGSLRGFSAVEMEKIVLAYEPVWAIGTGKTATPEQAEEMHGFIRRILMERFSKGTAEKVRILYGGSVKPENTLGLMSKENIDGALVGGASLKGESFIQIVKNAVSVQKEEARK